MKSLKVLLSVVCSLFFLLNVANAEVTKFEINSVLSEYGLSIEKTEFSIHEINKQESTSKVLFINALREALDSFLNDDADYESPNSIAQEVIYDIYENSLEMSYVEIKRAASIELKKMMINSMYLRLLTPSESPEHGESPIKNWIFHISIEDLSDHLFWAVVSKDGLSKTYSYGFN